MNCSFKEEYTLRTGVETQSLCIDTSLVFFLISFSKVSDVLVYKITYQNRICVLVRVLGPGGDRSTAVVALLPKNGEKREKKKMEAFRDDY